MVLDVGTLSASIASAAVAGGLIGGVVSWAVARRESKDRQAALTLEREKWETEQRDKARANRAELVKETLDLVADVHFNAQRAHRNDTDRANKDLQTGQRLRELLVDWILIDDDVTEQLTVLLTRYMQIILIDSSDDDVDALKEAAAKATMAIHRSYRTPKPLRPR